MRIPAEVYQMEAVLRQHLPLLRPAQQRGLALWVYGTILAHSACQTAVLAALLMYGSWSGIRQRLREWLYAGADRAAPCNSQVEVSQCFAGLLRWVLSGWQGQELALALDATLHGERLVALVVSVLYRGCAIPVAWHLLPANTKGAWLPAILSLFQRLHPAVPTGISVLVLADRGLWSPRLWESLRQLGWHPLGRIQNHMTFAASGRDRCPVAGLVKPGQAWVGRGRLGSPKRRRLSVTLIVVWAPEQAVPWAVVTDLAPRQVGVSWYALRMWVELGFKAIKSMGWQWQRTRRTEPERVSRYWLVIAVATLWVLVYGTRAEDAERLGVTPAQLRTPPALPFTPQPRRLSLFQRGLRCLQRVLLQGRWWQCWWLAPEPWPEPLPGLVITVLEET
jgi:hypothetical protein